MKPPRLVRLLPLALAASVAVSACGDDSNTLGPGNLEIAVAPTTMTLKPARRRTSTVTIVRSGDFDGAVNLSVTGLPDGVSAEPILGARRLKHRNHVFIGRRGARTAPRT